MNNLPAGTEYDRLAPWNTEYQQNEYQWFYVPFMNDEGVTIFYSKVLYHNDTPIDYSDDIETSDHWEECLLFRYSEDFRKA